MVIYIDRPYQKYDCVQFNKNKMEESLYLLEEYKITYKFLSKDSIQLKDYGCTIIDGMWIVFAITNEKELLTISAYNDDLFEKLFVLDR